MNSGNKLTGNKTKKRKGSPSIFDESNDARKITEEVFSDDLVIVSLKPNVSQKNKSKYTVGEVGDSDSSVQSFQYATEIPKSPIYVPAESPIYIAESPTYKPTRSPTSEAMPEAPFYSESPIPESPPLIRCTPQVQQPTARKNTPKRPKLKIRKKAEPWTEDETAALEEGLKHIKGPSWVDILKAVHPRLENRTNANLKDKARTMINRMERDGYGSDQMGAYRYVKHPEVQAGD